MSKRRWCASSLLVVLCLQGTITLVLGKQCFSTSCSGDGQYCCENNAKCCTRMTIGQIAACAIGGTVALALIIIGIVAAVIKYKKGDKGKVEPEQQQQRVNIASREKNKPVFEDPPPEYSLHMEHPGPFNPVLPPYSENLPPDHTREEYPNKHTL